MPILNIQHLENVKKIFTYILKISFMVIANNVDVGVFYKYICKFDVTEYIRLGSTCHFF